MTSSVDSLVKRLAPFIYLFGDKVVDSKTQQAYLADSVFADAFQKYNRIVLHIRFRPSTSSAFTTTLEFSRFDSLSFVVYSILDRLYELHPLQFAHSRDQWSKDWPNISILVGGALSYERYNLFQTKLGDLSESELTTEWRVRVKKTQSLEKKSHIRQAWCKVYNQMGPPHQKASAWIMDLIQEENNIRRLGQAGEEDEDVPMEEPEEKKKDVSMNLDSTTPILKRVREVEEVELDLQKRRKRQEEQIAMFPNASLLLKMFFSTTTSGGLHQALTPMLGNKEIRDLKDSAKKLQETKALDYRETDYISLNKWIEGFLIHPGVLYRYKAVAFDLDRFKGGTITDYWHSKLTLVNMYYNNTIHDEVKETPEDERKYMEALSIFQKYVTSIKISGRGWNRKTDPFLVYVIGSTSSIVESLTVDVFNFTGTSKLAEALKTNTSITTLNLHGNQIGDEGIFKLTEALKPNTTITTLHLSGNQIGDEGASKLAEALKTNTTITTLWLSSNRIGDKGASNLAEALKINASITTLDLSDSQMGDEGVSRLAEALKINTAVTTLNLSTNGIGDEGASELAEALKTNTTLTTLGLSYNQIGKEGADRLSETLDTNTMITTLDLSGNQIWDEGASKLAEALKTNTTITTLYLSYNEIGDRGASNLAEALKTNTSITTLWLFSNRIGDKGASNLAEALKINTVITTLNLSYNRIGADGASKLTEALKTNTGITTLDLSDNQIGDAVKLILSQQTNSKRSILI